MIVLISILFLLAIGYLVSKTFNFKLENSITLGFIGTSLLLFVFGMLNLLYVGFILSIIISGISALFLGYDLLKKKSSVKDFLKPSIVIWVIGIIILYFIVKGSHLSLYDEFYFWGTNIKAMFYKNILWNSKEWIGFHTSYPPLIGVISYFILKLNGSYNEGIIMFAYGLTMITLLLPLLSNIKKQHKSSLIIGLTLLLIPGVFNLSYKTICVDLILGVAFFISLYFSLEEQSKEHIVLLIFSLLALIFIKTSGIVLLGIVLITSFINNIYKHNINKQTIKKYLLVFGVISIFYLMFVGYKNINNSVLDLKHDNNYPVKISSVGEFSNVLLGKSKNKNHIATINNFLDKIINAEISSKNLPINKVLGVLIIINVGFYFILKNDKKLFKSITIGFNLGFIIYSLFLLFTFLFIFVPEEGVVNSSFERYMTTYFIAFTLLMVGYSIKNNNRLAINLFFIISLLGITNLKYYLNIYPEKDIINKDLVTYAETITNNVKMNDKVFIIYQSGTNIDFFKLKYLISPISTNLIGDWTYKKDANIKSPLRNQKALINALNSGNYDYLYIKNVDGYFMDNFGELFKDYIDAKQLQDFKNKLFKIKKIKKTVRLELVK